MTYLERIEKLVEAGFRKDEIMKIVASEKPTSTSEKPTSTSEKPTSTSEKPTSTSEKPTSTSEKPTGDRQRAFEDLKEIFSTFSNQVSTLTQTLQKSNLMNNILTDIPSAEDVAMKSLEAILNPVKEDENNGKCK